jgi:hypothetical protein
LDGVQSRVVPHELEEVAGQLRAECCGLTVDAVTAPHADRVPVLQCLTLEDTDQLVELVVDDL